MADGTDKRRRRKNVTLAGSFSDKKSVICFNVHCIILMMKCVLGTIDSFIALYFSTARESVTVRYQTSIAFRVRFSFFSFFLLFLPYFCPFFLLHLSKTENQLKLVWLDNEKKKKLRKISTLPPRTPFPFIERICALFPLLLIPPRLVRHVVLQRSFGRPHRGQEDPR
jgi:hypothetical protein